MLFGIGIDIVDITRFSKKIQQTPKLLNRLFVAEEQKLNPTSLAARFAAKEALAKALTAPKGLNWQHVWVNKTTNGAPYFVYTNTVAAEIVKLQIKQIKLSLSHDGNLATAMVVATC